MAWITVETNQGDLILRVNDVLHELTTHFGVKKLEEAVLEAVRAANRIEQPLESLEDDS